MTQNQLIFISFLCSIIGVLVLFSLLPSKALKPSEINSEGYACVNGSLSISCKGNYSKGRICDDICIVVFSNDCINEDKNTIVCGRIEQYKGKYELIVMDR